MYEVPSQFRKTIPDLKNDILGESCDEERKVPLKFIIC